MEENKSQSQNDEKEPKLFSDDQPDEYEFLKLFENNKPEENIPKVKRDEKEDAKQEKLRQKKLKKAERNKKYPSKLSFLLGLIVLIFAVIGIVLIAWNSISYLSKSAHNGSKYAVYNTYLLSIAAVDPDPFDDISAADTEQLLNAAIWSILSADSTPDTYSYSGGYMLIPSSDIGNAYIALFGQETLSSLEYKTVQGYNCVFEYDSSTRMYKIPITTIQPIYTPQVTDVEKSGSTLALTVNYLSAESWQQDSEGNYIAPEPDKVMKITLREIAGSYYISAIQTISSTIPEIIPFEPIVTLPSEDESSAGEETTAEPLTESTTLAVPEKTTLGGRVN